MKKGLLIFVCICISLTGLRADGYPEEWGIYISGDYIYDIQSGVNESSMEESAFRNYLTDLARTNIARSVTTKINDRSRLAKQSVDGRTSVDYLSVTQFSTDVELNLVKSKSVYDRKLKTGHAIAYIDRQEALAFYRNKALMAFSKVENAISLAEDYASQGFKVRASDILAKMTSELNSIDNDLFMLNFFGIPENELSDLSREKGCLSENLLKKGMEYRHGTKVYMECISSGDAGEQAVEVENGLKGLLSGKGCMFVDDMDAADWTISIGLSGRKYNVSEMGAMKIYTAYIDAEIDVANRGGDKILEKSVSEKGIHTMNYDEALREAGEKAGEKIFGTIYPVIIQ